MRTRLRASLKKVEKKMRQSNFFGAVFVRVCFSFACDAGVKSKCHPIVRALFDVL